MTAARALYRSKLLNRSISRMSSMFTYEDAVQKLNNLQSNKATIEQIRKNIQNGQLSCTNLEDMENYLSRTGVTLTTLDKLSVIHVAGTKGKGSTSAMCESILRHHGYKTGFFSSPHLVSVCERIRLDGQIISKDMFSQHFHNIYSLLDSTKEFEGDMPKYFAFLTVLAFNIFIKEKVDVAIVEVGIGGTVDYTNILRKVPVVGISALGIDHTSILGNTIEEIAQAKAGIMKPHCQAYTVTQPPEAMEVLKKAAGDMECDLHIVPDYNKYTFSKENKHKLHVDLDAYYMNASLAVQLAHAWMKLDKLKYFNQHKTVQKQAMNGKIIRQNDVLEIDSFAVTDKHKLHDEAEEMITSLPLETVQGLRNCRWPGRYQIIKADYAQFYLDGAHTKESVEICAKWFSQRTGDRLPKDSQSKQMWTDAVSRRNWTWENNRRICSRHFEECCLMIKDRKWRRSKSSAIPSRIVLSANTEKILVFSATGDRNSEMLLSPLQNVDFQKVLFVVPRAYKDVTQKNDNYSVMEEKELIDRCKRHAAIWLNQEKNEVSSNIMVMESVSEALIDIKQNNYSHVLVTGSLHLVGAALSILDRNLTA